MKKISTGFLQVVVVLIGVIALGFLLWEPHVEGRNAQATLFQIYFEDPFLAYVYIASIPFFVGLYQAFLVLGHLRSLEVPSQAVLRSLRIIKYCAMAIIAFAALGEIFIFMNTSDDRAGGVFVGSLILLGSIATATVASVIERVLRKRWR